MAEQLKILVCGDVESNFSKLFSKVKNVNKKSGPFDFLFCVGNFFGSNDEELLLYKSGKAKVPVPTYTLGPNNAESARFYPKVNGCELAPDIIYLGKRGVFVTSSGLSVAYVSGVEDNTLSSECQVTSTDIESVRNACIKSHESSYRGIDILLTSTWPANVTQLDANTLENFPHGSSLISKLALRIKPRYHFFGLGKQYYERRPYKNEDIGFGRHITRAIALANVANEKKQKFLFAMNLTPFEFMKESELYMMTTNTTECPYRLEDENSTKQYFYDMNYKETGKKSKRKNNDFQHRNQKIMNVSQNDCWFCLASPKFEKRLVVSIGEEAYLTLAKGGLVWDHVIILPIAHYRSYSEMPSSLLEEIEKFKSSLVKYYSTERKTPIFFDRNYKTPHYQIQVVPVPSDCLKNVNLLFKEIAEEKGFLLTEIPDNAVIKNILQTESSYFYVEIGSCRLIHTIKKIFPLQFGREVLAHPQILNVPDRIEWKNIESTEENEIKCVEKFRSEYNEFDFTVS